MSLVGARRVDLKEVSKDGVEEARAPVKNAEPVGEAEDHDLTAEEIAANCARALASLRGRRESERLEREAWETLRKRGSKLRESGNEASMMKEADATKETRDSTKQASSSSSSIESGQGVWTPRRSSACKEETEEAKRMRSMLQQQWHLLWMVDAMNQHRRAAGVEHDRAVSGEVHSSSTGEAEASPGDGVEKTKPEGSKAEAEGESEEKIDTMEYALALATAAPEYAAAVANWWSELSPRWKKEIYDWPPDAKT
ncbi:hypothetical protein FOZ61_009348 [Perkinsus olseni]|uniref:Uncharacterized protein n=1 Tax=Perkinsus olseni TaxID=32597 RepID=A0A7J6L129_PEROL|nr:hypothetical protein FOZ61_009348 [Perkinsus olseni]KAF4654971.1 hypothetical protein FOL46_008447 [Perkinsus olseni]